MKNFKSIDLKFLWSVLILTISGFLIFFSASLGILTRNEDIFKKIAVNQFLFGVIIGLAAMIFVSFIPVKFWRKYSIILFISSALLTLLVFVPGIGWRHGGALRWIQIGGYNFQPSEILKIGYLMILAYFFSKSKDESKYFKYKLLPFLSFTFIIGVIIMLQPDNDTFFMAAVAGTSMFIVAGAKWKDIAIIFLIGLVLGTSLYFIHPYVRSRVNTFINPASNPLSSGYQVQQSLIAIGSGGFLGKGFGQSTQKFGFLPEPTGDSIFAVASEEFGFIGSVVLILLFLFFALRGLKIASKSEDDYSRLLVVGIVIIIITGSFINIASMLSLMPLSGTPLLFVSHGGSALVLALVEVGIILQVSKNKKKAVNL